METAEIRHEGAKQREPDSAKRVEGRPKLKFSQTFAAACDDGARENRASSDESAPVATFGERVRM